jgi:hypothetical protein
MDPTMAKIISMGGLPSELFDGDGVVPPEVPVGMITWMVGVPLTFSVVRDWSVCAGDRGVLERGLVVAGVVDVVVCEVVVCREDEIGGVETETAHCN